MGRVARCKVCVAAVASSQDKLLKGVVGQLPQCLLQVLPELLLQILAPTVQHSVAASLKDFGSSNPVTRFIAKDEDRDNRDRNISVESDKDIDASLHICA